MSIIEDMNIDHQCVEDYHCLEIIDAWSRAGGSVDDLFDLLAFWPKCTAIAQQRAGVNVLWCHVAEAAEELLDQAKAALQAGRLQELACAWWPEGVPGASAQAPC